MSVAYRTSALGNNGLAGNTSAMTVTIPATGVAGDLALYCIWQNTGANTFTTPAGWSLLSGPDSINSNLSAYLYAKVLASGEPNSSLTVNSSGSARWASVMDLYSGAAGVGSLILAAAPATTTANTATQAAPTATATTANCQVCEMFAVRNASTSTGSTLSIAGGFTIGGNSKTSFTSSPNDAAVSAHLTSNTTTTGTVGGVSATSDIVSTSVAYTVIIPSASTYDTNQFFFMF